jgi:hypothetical protein
MAKPAYESFLPLKSSSHWDAVMKRFDKLRASAK